MRNTSLRQTGEVVGGLVGFLGLSVAAGVLVAATVTPAIALTANATNATIGVFDGIPDYLALDELAQKSNIYAVDSAGAPVLMASFYQQNRVEVGWDAINQFVKDAAVSAEDPRFYEHVGVDLMGTARAIISNAGGGDPQGGSSITQQYVKNVLVQKAEAITDEAKRKAAYEEATETSESRKIREIRMAVGLEKRYGKQDILRGYLNIAGFGGRVYGIEAAASYYFNTNAANLTLEQAATLMAIVNNPETLRIDRPDRERNGAANGYAETLLRRHYVLTQMLKEGKISQEQFNLADETPIAPTITQPSTGCTTAANVSPGSGYFCDYVTKVFQNDPVFGATDDERWTNFIRGGYEVYTTLDLDLQHVSQTTLDEYVPHAVDTYDVGSVSVTVQPGTGRILAMAQNKDYANDPDVLATGPNYSAINYNTDFEYGGSAGFQPGSTYKIFTLIEWLKEGHGLGETVDAQRRANWGTFKDSCVDGGTVSAGAWNPKNDEGGNGGTWSALFNTVNSENTGFIAMAKKLDLCGIRDTAASMGVHRADGGELSKYPSDVLGTNEVAPISMAAAFATLAAGGMMCDPIAIDRIVKHDGTEIPAPGANCRQALEPDIAAAANSALQQTFAGGTTSQSRIGDGIPVIGKTGTTDDNKATWMSGASTKAATVTGVFNATGHADLRSRSSNLNGRQAAGIRHFVWPAVMAVANSKYGGDAFATPPRDSGKYSNPEPSEKPSTEPEAPPAPPAPEPPAPEPSTEPTTDPGAGG
ncbi:transglycosylase domain-containing protein [Plantibacter sp. Mn2098]|uniref:transglycosylase domain-containing protein n=1 Tax=Plantibacter sp. Mn2098 TaxID=3395266 RepID=UPI003BBE58D7